MKDDVIYRQAAIDALGERPVVWTTDDEYSLGARNQYDTDKLAIETVPSAQPEIEERMSETEQNVPNDDFISRKRAIDALMEDFKRIPTNAIRAKTVIEQLPSAQPEIIHCRDCKHRGEKPIADGRYWCEIHDTFMYYCSDAERRTDE